MTLILDAGGVSALAGQRARLIELRRRGLWPAQVPSIVLAESLTGDHRRDFHTNRLLRACQIRDVTEPHAREAARLRTTCSSPIVITSDTRDLAALSEHAAHPITIVRG